MEDLKLPYRKNKLYRPYKLSINWSGEKEYYEFSDNYISKWDKYLYSSVGEKFEITDVKEINCGKKIKSFVKIKEGELDINKFYYVKLSNEDYRKLKLYIRDSRLKKLVESQERDLKEINKK